MVAKKSVDIGPKQAFLQPNKLIKFIEPYTSTKGTLREEVCSRLIKPTSQAYLGNVRLLTQTGASCLLLLEQHSTSTIVSLIRMARKFSSSYLP